MLRGRLDGAERLITAILPDSYAETMREREPFIQEAQEAIAKEWQEFEDGLNLDMSVEKKNLIRHDSSMGPLKAQRNIRLICRKMARKIAGLDHAKSAVLNSLSSQHSRRKLPVRGNAVRRLVQLRASIEA